MKISGNTILVTGGTSGIGRELSETFHDRGNIVIVTRRRLSLLDEITHARPGMVGMHLDLNDQASLTALAEKVRIRFPKLNVVIANAGISRAEDMTSASWNADDAESIVETNILSVLRVAAEFLPVLQKRPNAVFMATSSALAFVPRADFPTYCATKAFLHSWLTSVRHQLKMSSVEILEMSPPYLQTELTGTLQATDPRAMPLKAYISELMEMLEVGKYASGELLLERDYPRRWAERDGTYDTIFAALNPS